MPIVDASVALKWVIDEEGSEAASALAAESLISPSMILAECANALWAKALRREITAAEVLERLALLRAAPVLLVPLEELVEDATRLAVTLGHPVYDCLYLALAVRENTRLVTADQQFARVVREDKVLSGHLQLLGEP
jgi:predicted nucleic acid-binding protein